jgi:hypothetical protein
MLTLSEVLAVTVTVLLTVVPLPGEVSSTLRFDCAGEEVVGTGVVSGPVEQADPMPATNRLNPSNRLFLTRRRTLTASTLSLAHNLARPV